MSDKIEVAERARLRNLIDRVLDQDLYVPAADLGRQMGDSFARSGAGRAVNLNDGRSAGLVRRPTAFSQSNSFMLSTSYCAAAAHPWEDWIANKCASYFVA